MTVKPTPSAWVDPDDAPDLSAEDFKNATWRIGERVVSPAEGMAAFRAQARMNEALRNWLRTHKPA